MVALLVEYVSVRRAEDVTMCAVEYDDCARLRLTETVAADALPFTLDRQTFDFGIIFFNSFRSNAMQQPM